jgi:hypothetical protein
MTSTPPTNVIQQGLSNKSNNGTLTQQSILTYISTSTSTTLQNPEKIKNIKNPQKINPTIQPHQQKVQPIPKKSRLYDNSVNLTANKFRVNSYKSFCAPTTSNSTKDSLGLTQTQITTYAKQTYSRTAMSTYTHPHLASLPLQTYSQASHKTQRSSLPLTCPLLQSATPAIIQTQEPYSLAKKSCESNFDPDPPHRIPTIALHHTPQSPIQADL